MPVAIPPDETLKGKVAPTGSREYKLRHRIVRVKQGSPRTHPCVKCLEKGVDQQARDWARVHTETGENPWNDYVPLCRPCHLRYDLDSFLGRKRSEEAKANMSVAQMKRYQREREK